MPATRQLIRPPSASWRSLPALIALSVCVLPYTTQAAELSRIDIAGSDHQLNAPQGAKVEQLAELEAPRMISIGLDGEMFIGSHAGKVYRLAPPYQEAETLVELGGYPHSVVQRGDQLYVATTDALLRADYRAGASLSSDDFEEVAELPGGGGHSSRTLSLGPDQRLYVSLGIQGNCSDQYIGADYDFSQQRGGVMVLDESGDSSEWAPYASGLRNPIGLAWDNSGILFAINNGPDHWGYDEPAEVLVRTEESSFHGMPWYHWVNGEFQRDDCIASQPPQGVDSIPEPVATLPARSAPMGLTFLPENSGLELDAVTAVHGSWATQPDGAAAGDPASRREPMVAGISIDEQGKGKVSELLTGFQNDKGERWARPAGIAYAPDGALYFTSDQGESGLYRMTLEGEPIDVDSSLDQAPTNPQ